MADLVASETESLAPGRYTRSGFEPIVTFEVGEGWYGVQQFEGFFDIQQDVGSPDVIAVQFARPSAFVGAGGEHVPATTAAEAETVIQANPGLTVLGSSDSRLGGLEGRVVEVENTTGGGVEVMIVPPGPLSILDGRRLWIALLETDGGLLAVLVGGSVATWNQALATAEPVLESIQIRP